MKQVHGTFTSFADMAKAMGIKVPKAKEVAKKCPACGAPLDRIGNTNVWKCDFYKLREDKLVKGEKEIPVQVFSKCGNMVIDNS